MAASVAVTAETCNGFLNCFLVEMKAPDWVQCALLLVAVIALWATWRTLREQTRSRDFENYFALKDRISNAWRLFGRASDDERFFEFTELVNELESACRMFHGGVLKGETRKMISEYLEEIIPAIYSDPLARTMIEAGRSSPDTYGEIEKFGRDHGIDFSQLAIEAAQKVQFQSYDLPTPPTAYEGATG